MRAQAGIALLIALGCVALVAATAATLLAQQALWARQLENAALRAQADALARAGIDRVLRHPASDGPELPPLGGLRLELDVADAQARFNLNNLAPPSEPDLRDFRRVLAAAGLPAELAAAAARRVASRPLEDIEELAQAPGFSRDDVERLRPLAVALPEPTALNINSASPRLVAALIPGATEGLLAPLLAARPFAELEAFRSRLPAGLELDPGTRWGVRSRYLLVTSCARSEAMALCYEALAVREGEERAELAWRRERAE